MVVFNFNNGSEPDSSGNIHKPTDSKIDKDHAEQEATNAELISSESIIVDMKVQFNATLFSIYCRIPIAIYFLINM